MARSEVSGTHGPVDGHTAGEPDDASLTYAVQRHTVGEPFTIARDDSCGAPGTHVDAVSGAAAFGRTEAH